MASLSPTSSDLSDFNSLYKSCPFNTAQLSLIYNSIAESSTKLSLANQIQMNLRDFVMPLDSRHSSSLVRSHVFGDEAMYREYGPKAEAFHREFYRFFLRREPRFSLALLNTEELRRRLGVMLQNLCFLCHFGGLTGVSTMDLGDIFHPYRNTPEFFDLIRLAQTASDFMSTRLKNNLSMSADFRREDTAHPNYHRYFRASVYGLHQRLRQRLACPFDPCGIFFVKPERCTVKKVELAPVVEEDALDAAGTEDALDDSGSLDTEGDDEYDEDDLPIAELKRKGCLRRRGRKAKSEKKRRVV